MNGDFERCRRSVFDFEGGVVYVGVERKYLIFLFMNGWRCVKGFGEHKQESILSCGNEEKNWLFPTCVKCLLIRKFDILL